MDNCKHIIDLELESGDIIVKDGSLQTSHTNEYKCVDKVFDKAIEKMLSSLDYLKLAD